MNHDAVAAIGELPLDDALRWVVDALLDGNVEQSTGFFDLDPPAQFLAVQALRTAARAGLALAGLDPVEIVAEVSAGYRRWLGP